MPRLSVTRGLLALLLASSAGCGGPKEVPPPDYGSPDGLKIAQAVSEFNDAKADAAEFKKAFVANPPANWREYDKFSFNVVVGSPKVSGDGATAGVTVHKETNYEVVATVEWSFTKVGDAWKLKAAPLK